MKLPIITLEDGTQVLGTTGDMDAFEYGGGVLFRAPDCRGIFWSFWVSRDLGNKNYHVFTAPVPNNVIEHFDPDLDELSIVSGIDARDIERLSRSKDHSERLQIVMAIRDCSGSSRVDPSHEPEILSLHELCDRWGAVFGVDPSEIPQADHEDFIVRETPHGDYECGCVDGRYLGRHQEYKHALCAIADFMKENGYERSNLFHEHARGQLEIVSWDPETFSGKIPPRRGKLPVARWRNCMKHYATTENSREDIAGKAKSRKGVTKDRNRAKARLAQKDRIRRGREMNRSMQEIHGSQ